VRGCILDCLLSSAGLGVPCVLLPSKGTALCFNFVPFDKRFSFGEFWLDSTSKLGAGVNFSPTNVFERLS
jgi:hypothetical protein